MTRILMVLSAADKWTRSDGSIYESGVWAEEFVVVDETLIQAGFQVDIATPGAKRPIITAAISPAARRGWSSRRSWRKSTWTPMTRWSCPAATGRSRISTRTRTWAASWSGPTARRS